MSSHFIERKTVAEFLTQAIVNSTKTQKQIAEEIGYDKPNMITMLKQGLTRVPMTKVGPLAKALGVDPIFFLRFVLMEYTPETYEAIEHVLEVPLLTKKELHLIESFRKVTNWTDPAGIFVEGDGVKIVTGFLIPFQEDSVFDDLD